MRLPQYLRRHREDDDTPYNIGGAVGVFTFLIVAFFALAATQSYLLRSGSLAAVISAVLAELANSDRSANAVGTLSVSPLLTRVAEAKARDMAAKSYFAHTSPEGKDPWYWFAQEGYAFIYAGENLAVDFSDSAVVEEAWMNSTEHRANLLDGRYTEIGIATARGTFEGHATTYVVQVFGTPAPTPAPVRVVQATTPVEPATPAVATATLSAPQPVVAAAASTSPTPTPGVVEVATPSAAPPVEVVPAQAGVWARLLASPQTVLSYLYYALAVAILLLLAYVTEMEFHKRHLRHLVAASALLVLMGGLFTLAELLLFARPVLAAPLVALGIGGAAL